MKRLKKFIVLTSQLPMSNLKAGIRFPLKAQDWVIFWSDTNVMSFMNYDTLWRLYTFKWVDDQWKLWNTFLWLLNTYRWRISSYLHRDRRRLNSTRLIVSADSYVDTWLPGRLPRQRLHVKFELESITLINLLVDC